MKILSRALLMLILVAFGACGQVPQNEAQEETLKATSGPAINPQTAPDNPSAAYEGKWVVNDDGNVVTGGGCFLYCDYSLPFLGCAKYRWICPPTA